MRIDIVLYLFLDGGMHEVSKLLHQSPPCISCQTVHDFMNDF